MLHHNLPGAAADYARGTSEALWALYGDHSDAAPAPVRSKYLFVNGRSEPLWRRLPQPRRLHAWMSEEEMDYYIREYERNGWAGGLKWYCVCDIDWAATPQLQGKR